MIESPPPFVPQSVLFSLIKPLLEEGILQKIQDEYLYWSELKYKKTKSATPEQLWQAVKLYRLLNQRTLQFGNYHFSYVLTDYIQQALHHFDMHIGGTLTSNMGITEVDTHKFMVSSIMEESIASSQIEGANTTRKKAKEMIQKGIKPKSKSEQMIVNNYHTMQYIVQHKDEPLSAENLLHIHQLIAHKTLDLPEEEGAFRTHNNIYVVDFTNSEVVHTPPDTREIPQLIKELCSFFNNNSAPFIHPLVKACVLHFMIGFIHPFTDGNGRTARAVFYWYMLKSGYWLTEYLSISRIIKGTKKQYEKAYLHTEADDNDLSYFITYQLRAMEKAFEDLKTYINRKQKEIFQASQFMKIPGVNDRMAQIIKIIYDDPDRVLSIKEIENRFLISNHTARTDLKQLVDMGFLEVIPVNKKKQSYIKSPLFFSLLETKIA
jgi:fic family protein